MGQPVENMEAIAQVASISAGNDDTVGSMIANALEKVGRDGIISLEEGKSTTTELDVTEGMRFEKGFVSPYFVNRPEKMEVVLENPYVLVTDKKRINSNFRTNYPNKSFTSYNCRRF